LGAITRWCHEQPRSPAPLLRAKPHIVHGYFTDPADRETMTRALRVLAGIAAHPALASHRRADMRVPASGSQPESGRFR